MVGGADELVVLCLPMKVRVFVSTTAGLLLLWLGVTYVREVPYENYPRLGKGSQPLSAEAKSGGEAEALISLEKAEPAEALAEVE
jgi:hypothetical protein